MMKIILLLTFVVYVSSATLKNDKHLLEQLIDQLNTTLKRLPTEPKKEIYLRNLKTESCEHEFYCQVEQELVKKVSGLTKFDDFRTDKILMRNLHMYNNHIRSTCKPVDEDQDEIPLRTFLETFKKCVQKAYSQKKN